MPKIKVYRDGDYYVPVNKAKIVNGYECPFSGRVYLRKKDYIQNLKVVREGIHSDIQYQNRDKKIAELNDVKSFDEMINWIESESNFMFDLFYDGRHATNQNKKIRDTFSVKITGLSLYWSNCVSNSHSCPRNGVTNWRGKNEYPKGYPGWTGTIEYEVSHGYPRFTSSVFEQLGINFGTGGSGRNEVRIYADDWPSLAEWASFNMMINNSHQLNYEYQNKTPL